MHGFYLTNGIEHPPKRSSFASIQLSHHVPSKHSRPSRVRTGYELVVPQKTSSTFVGKAKQSGKVLSIDEKLKTVTVMYKDKTVDIFEYGNQRGDTAGSYLKHDIQLVKGMKKGKRIKAGEVVVYHAGFFHLDPVTDQLSWSHGIPANVAIMAKDVTLEDSNMITAKFAEKLGFESIYLRSINITSDMIISDHIGVGDKVTYDDTLISLKYEETAELIGSDVDELFEDLKAVEYRCKHTGEIFEIKVYYVSDDISESIKKFVNKITYTNRRKAKSAKGTNQEAKYTLVNKVPPDTRINGVSLGETDVLIDFYIKTDIACGIGDKILLDSSLKTVTGRVESEPIITEHGVDIDVVFGAASIQDRIILSPLITGITDTVLAKAEKDIVDMYFSEK